MIWIKQMVDKIKKSLISKTVSAKDMANIFILSTQTKNRFLKKNRSRLKNLTYAK